MNNKHSETGHANLALHQTLPKKKKKSSRPMIEPNSKSRHLLIKNH